MKLFNITLIDINGSSHFVCKAESAEAVVDRSNVFITLVNPTSSTDITVRKEYFKQIIVNNEIVLGPFKYQSAVNHLRLLEGITEYNVPTTAESLKELKRMILESIVSS